MSSPAPATGNTYEANLYPATTQQNVTTPTGAVCFSGGGSRALSCALGQLSALTSPPPSGGSPLLSNFKYISSVSGGSWASVLYSFLPSTFSDQDFLISCVAPGSLTQAGMQTMSANCLGSVPQQFGLESVGDFLYKMWKWGALDPLSGISSWFWIAAIGELVLKPFSLYDATYSDKSPYLLPSSFFSLSQGYVTNNLLPNNPGLQGVPFYSVSPNGRPTLIVNFNLLNGDYSQDPPQMPIQATAISTGSPGSAPSAPGKPPIAGGGSVESFAFTSTLGSGGTQGQDASVTMNRWYSLCDIAGCSSAFFAEYLLQYINKGLDDLLDYIAKEYNLSAFDKDALWLILTGLIDALSSQVIPAYNYWEVGKSNPGNNTYGFSDGGDFENTGILGVLAQTDVNRIVAFINSEIAITPSGSSYTVDPCLPILFGVGENGNAQVFDNTGAPGNTPLEQLCKGLYNASCGDSQLGTYTAAFTQTLTTVANPVSGIAAGRQITVLWVYNNRVNKWQAGLTDNGLTNDLTKGQANQNSNGTPNGGSFDGPLPTLANFPYYDTGEQIYLPPEAVNMLGQLSAWNVEQLVTQIQALFQ